MALINDKDSNVLHALWEIQDVRNIHRTGSRVICEPPVTTTDDDYVICARSEAVAHALLSLGFRETTASGENYMLSPTIWRFFRLEHINIILTCDTTAYGRFYLATCIAADLNLTEKGDRVALFHRLVDAPEQAEREAAKQGLLL